MGIVQGMEESPQWAGLRAVRNDDVQERLTGETEVEGTSFQGQIRVCDSVALFMVQFGDKKRCILGIRKKKASSL